MHILTHMHKCKFKFNKIKATEIHKNHHKTIK